MSGHIGTTAIELVARISFGSGAGAAFVRHAKADPNPNNISHVQEI